MISEFSCSFVPETADPQLEDPNMRLFKKNKSRDTGQIALKALAAVPNSGSPSAANSQGASAGVADLIKGLDFVLEDWDGNYEYY